ncbi:MAG: hypothetical protein JSU58_11135 [Dehalococcoidales bacterium]|nr:MAG: hypothetical protein JSU58_11135 [Dehalococcoidales bacterium]
MYNRNIMRKLNNTFTLSKIPFLRLFILLSVVGLFCLSVFPVKAQAHPADAEESGSFVVFVDLAILDIPEVDELAETFEIDAYLRLKWNDRSAYSAIGKEIPHGSTYHSDSTSKAMEVLENIGWFYIVEIANQVGERNTLLASLSITPEGEIEYMERLQVTLRSEYELNRYPFDSQVLRIRIESFAYDASKLIFEDDAIVFYRTLDSKESRLILEEWELPGNIWSEADVSHSQLMDTDWPYIEAHIEIQRKFGYHVWKIFLPMLLIISISWSVFWIGKENVSSRLSLSLISLLTVISFNFFVSTNLPKISYLTFMDYFVLGIYVFMTLAVIEVLSTYLLSSYGKELIASRIHLHSRWVFPVFFILYLLIMVLAVWR